MDQAAPLDPATQTALRTMHDIITPDPVSWLPQTWGFALVATVIAMGLLVWLVAAVTRYRRNAYRREALRQLDLAGALVRKRETRAQGLQEIVELLKRTALAAFRRERVASLTGKQFSEFLAATADGVDTHPLASLLDDLEYRADAVVFATARYDLAQTIETARHWIEVHRVRA